MFNIPLAKYNIKVLWKAYLESIVKEFLKMWEMTIEGNALMRNNLIN